MSQKTPKVFSHSWKTAKLINEFLAVRHHRLPMSLLTHVAAIIEAENKCLFSALSEKERKRLRDMGKAISPSGAQNNTDGLDEAITPCPLLAGLQV